MKNREVAEAMNKEVSEIVKDGNIRMLKVYAAIDASLR